MNHLHYLSHVALYFMHGWLLFKLQVAKKFICEEGTSVPISGNPRINVGVVSLRIQRIERLEPTHCLLGHFLLYRNRDSSPAKFFTHFVE